MNNHVRVMYWWILKQQKSVGALQAAAEYERYSPKTVTYDVLSLHVARFNRSQS